MKISKVYYEELKSKCVGGKWESVRIGAEVAMDNNEIGYRESGAYVMAKEFVREKMSKELGYDVEKSKIVKQSLEQINKDIGEALAML